ncbi:MAG: hypothetical protein ABR592_08200 [Nitriliruptorales bacterium]
MRREGPHRGRILGLAVVTAALVPMGLAMAQERELEGKVRSGGEVVVPEG